MVSPSSSLPRSHDAKIWLRSSFNCSGQSTSFLARQNDGRLIIQGIVYTSLYDLVHVLLWHAIHGHKGPTLVH
jgi:hypothetical protein